MSKKMRPTTAGETTPAVVPGWGDWFDRWPEMFARRWPEAFHGVPFVDDGFRMEQYVDEDGTLVVRGELPGLDPDDDVTITVDDDRLMIEGEREEKEEETTNEGYRSEFRYGSFRRTVHLPAGARTDDIEATYRDGILEVRVPVEERTTEVTKVPIAKK